MDASVPAIAHGDHPPQATPYVPVEPHVAKQWRLYYMATIAWMDSQLGRVMDELETLNHHKDTLVVCVHTQSARCLCFDGFIRRLIGRAVPAVALAVCLLTDCLCEQAACGSWMVAR